jgi:hypothetical protein
LTLPVGQFTIATGVLDRSQHLAQVVFDIGIGKSNNAIALIIEQLCSLLILLRLRIVDTSIDLNYQSCFGAIEVGDEPPQWMLPAKFESTKLAVV